MVAKMQDENPNLGQAPALPLRITRKSREEQLANLALTKLEQLRGRLSAEHEVLWSITFDDLVRSACLRSLVLDYDLTLFKSDPKPLGSFERKFDTARDAEIAQE